MTTLDVARGFGTLETSPCLAEAELTYKTKVKSSNRRKVEKSSDLNEIFREIFDVNTIEHHEEMKILLLNRANRVLGWAKISQGGIAGTVVDVKIIMQLALLSNASFIVMCHNHPSDNLRPSEADIKITKNIQNAGTLLEIKLLDHLIITSEGFYSFSDEGIL